MDLSRDRLTDIFENLQLKDIRSGFKGLAQFAYDNIIWDEEGKKIGLLCSDADRGKFRYLGENKKMVTDIDAVNFTKAILEHGNKRIDMLMKELKPKGSFRSEYDKLRKQLKELMVSGNGKFI